MGEGTPRKLATAISENCYQPELNTLLNGAVQIEETGETAVASILDVFSP
jgi:hypothetical protein